MENYDLTEKQKKMKPVENACVQYWWHAKNMTTWYDDFELKPVCYTTTRFGDFISFGVFHKESGERADQYSKRGHGEADCYHWIYVEGRKWLETYCVEKFLLGD